MQAINPTSCFFSDNEAKTFIMPVKTSYSQQPLLANSHSFARNRRPKAYDHSQ
jgi:hypothetical protein